MTTKARRFRSDISESQQSLIPVNEAGTKIACSIAALALAALIYWNYHAKLGIKSPNVRTQSDRFLYAVRLSFFSLIPLLVSIVHVMLGRTIYPLARNPLSADQHLVEKSNRILTNTVEQLLLYQGNLFIFAILVPKDYLIMMPFVAFCFLLGRITFLIGYVIHPTHREFGFVWTFAPTMCMFAYNLFNISFLVE